MSVNRNPVSKTTRSGTTHYKGATCIPVSSTASTAAATLTNDIIVGNATLFPQASVHASVNDKVKYHKLKVEWVPALPTTCGGTGVMFFDSDRTDAGPTTMQEAMQNKGAKAGPLWSKSTYNVDRKMLRSNEMFSTLSGTGTTAATNNTFTGPGKLHFYHTSQPGITYTTSTVIGFLMIEYELEFMFPSSKTDTVVPTRRLGEVARDVSSVTYDSETVNIWQNFAAGCVVPPDFYTFLSLFDSEGHLVHRRALPYQPDETSFSLAKHTSQVTSSTGEKFLIRSPEVGATNPKILSESERVLIGGLLHDINNYEYSDY